MKVRKLIELLMQEDPEAIVMISMTDPNYGEIKNTAQKVVRNDRFVEIEWVY